MIILLCRWGAAKGGHINTMSIIWKPIIDEFIINYYLDGFLDDDI